MKPISAAKHEAQESPAIEKKEHATGKEMSERPFRGKPFAKKSARLFSKRGR